ncbi:MAG: response regulator [Clostridia bacterium]|nr:response regulator [Clostridia bacterium]
MYNVIIIDEKQDTARDLENFVNWQNFDAKIVGVFNNSRDALNYLKTNEVDIIVTDIKMSKISGIDIAKLCHTEYPDTKIIFVSSTRDFNYARQALKYNVYYYLTKPLNKKETYETFEGLFEAMFRANRRQIDTSDQFTYARQEFFSDLLIGRISTLDALNLQLSTLGFPYGFSKNGGFVINIHINNFTTYLKKVWKYGQYRLYNAIMNIVHTDNEDMFIEFVRYSRNNIEIIAIVKNPVKTNIDRYMSELKTTLYEILSIHTDISVLYDFKTLNDFIQQKFNPASNRNAELENIPSKVMKYIEQNYMNDISLSDISNFVALSRGYFCAYYKQKVGENFIDTLTRVRIEKAKEILKDSDTKVCSVSEMVGYKSPSYFHKTFKSYTDLTPNEYKAKFAKKHTTA